MQEDTNPKQVLPKEILIDGDLDSDILSEEKAIPALRSRRRSYILDYLSSFLDYPKHGEKFKRNNGRIQNTFWRSIMKLDDFLF